VIRAIAVLVLLVPLGSTWREAPEYRPLFAPRRTHADAYGMYVSPLDIDTAIRDLQSDPSLLHPPGSWQPRATLPFDAFGQTGGYDRWKLARLYGALRPRVARGPKALDGRVIESWTLISPYPDPTFQRLEPGTLLIVLKVP
jgi:hypothetical protein